MRIFNIIKYLALYLLLSLPAYSATDYAEIGLPVTEIYDSFVHKGGNQNWWLAQAKNGLIYNGTGTGLNEWDGERWSIYNTPQKSRIRSLSIWKDDKIYIGTSNDIGYYAPGKTGILTYHSLLSDWSFEERQFGEIWSTAANKHGVMFLSQQYLLFWDGKTLQKVSNAVGGRHRVFNIDDVFYYKANDSQLIYSITFNPNLAVLPTEIKLPKETNIRKILRNNNGHLTFITGKLGIYEMTDSGLVNRLSGDQFPENTNLYNGIQATDGYYYLTSLNHGIFIVDAKFQLVKHYTKEQGLGTNTILSVIEDFQGTMWFSGVPNIVKFMPPHWYSHYKTNIDINSSENITLLRGKVSLIGDSVLQLDIPVDKIKPATFKNIHTTRMSTWDAIEYENHLLYAGTGGVYAMQYSDDNDLSKQQNILKTTFAKGFAIDELTNTLFITTEEGLFKAKFVNQLWSINKIPNTEDELHYIAIENGIVWVGTSTQELYKIENAQFPEKSTTIKKFIDKDGLGPNNVLPFNTSLGVVFGTNDGLMNYQQERQPQLQFLGYLPEIFHTKGLDVYRLFEDQQNNIWYRIGNRTGVLNRDENNQWQINEDLFRFFPDSGYKGFVKSDDKILWFSLANGDIFRANTDLIQNKPEQGKLNVRQIINLDNEQELYGGLGKAHLNELTQENNSLRIQFALADNSIANKKNSNQVQYRQRLLGSSNEQFSKWSTESQKDFTLLRGGEYQFEVQAKDAWDRIANKQMGFNVLPPWYLSKTAWIVYIISAMLLLVVSSWLTQKWRTKQLNLRNLALEQEVKERTADVQAKANELKQQQELKDRFFTNVSHEFRTPLTLTIAPLEKLLNDNKNLDGKLSSPINTALRNSKKMLSLVSQVLDINRLEAGRFPLHVAQYDLSNLINNTAKRFGLLLEKNQQTLSLHNTQDPHLVHFDLDQLEKCISNLLANAIKYSGKGSRIELSMVIEEKQTGIKVSDNGKGINPAFEAKIFERFTQDEESEHITEPGTGIGLALVKELMELHHGQVELNNDSGKGCEFTLWLKSGHEHFESSQLVEPITRNKKELQIEIPILKALGTTELNKFELKDITTILVVDDNQELREFIASILQDYYRIIQASDGKEGFDMAQTFLPDLIISDVMMPVMDGLEMTQKLKASPYTKTIPIIVLTAKSSKRETVTGLQSGADDYLTKPFDTSELITRATGLINNRKMIRQSIKAELSQEITHLGKTSDFIDQLRNEILSQLSDPELSVESISSALAMSRHSLNRKCKSELNKTTGQVITETRMQHALSLLKLNKHSISEIAYGTGYDSLAYFSRTFKKHYGKTPTEIRNA